MRCGCRQCGAYMDHSQGPNISCVCLYCGYRCTACLGTNSVISRETFQKLRTQPELAEVLFSNRQADEPPSDALPEDWDDSPCAPY